MKPYSALEMRMIICLFSSGMELINICDFSTAEIKNIFKRIFFSSECAMKERKILAFYIRKDFRFFWVAGGGKEEVVIIVF